MRGGGAHAGNFFVGDKEGGGGFTDEDEEMLLLFASQAASAVANARAHAGLEALVETSPVGVTVFDAHTTEPATLNLEARRIVEALGLPGSCAADRIGKVTTRLSDGREETIVRALEAGAVDYIVKPFSAAELTARVGAALRHRDGAEPFVHGDLTIDYDRRLVTVAGREIELTPTEYELLRTRSVNAGRVTPLDSLLRQVWAGRETTNVQAVRNFVKKLRRKIGDDSASPSFILNVRGVGYKMPKPGEG